jgi:hypothetical protein
MRLRRRTILLIHSFLLVQVLLPFSYYLGRPDPNDERFAWRMFSPTRLLHCTPTFVLIGGSEEEAQPIRLVGRERSPGDFEPGAFHEAWVTLAQRGRGAVIDAMAEELCRRHPGRSVRARVACREVDGRSYLLRDGSRDACAAEPR